MSPLIEYEDVPVFLNSIVQLIAFIYITKVCFIGKCSIIRNIVNVIMCIVLYPILTFFLAVVISSSLKLSDTVLIYIQDGFLGNVLLFSVTQLLILIITATIYVLYCGIKNRSLALFSYIMFYMVSMFGVFMITTISGRGFLFTTICIVFVCMIQFLFCYYILPQIKRLSIEKNNVNKWEFYFLPEVYVFLCIVMIGYCGTQEVEVNLLKSFFAIAAFLEIILLVTFKALLNNLSQVHEISKQNEKLESANNKIKTLSVEVMEALAHTIDAKDEYTRGHSIRVAEYSRMIAKKMELSDEQCENIYYMGLLHDIGKIGVPNEIINKNGKLTDEEYCEIKKHPVTGYDILAEIKSRPDLAIGARWHHERVDGKGYPDHKNGDEIPLEARIIAVADSYDAMTSNRSYRNYLPQDVARSEIEKNIGTQFDERVARRMIELIDEDTEYTMHE